MEEVVSFLGEDSFLVEPSYLEEVSCLVASFLEASFLVEVLSLGVLSQASSLEVVLFPYQEAPPSFQELQLLFQVLPIQLALITLKV